MTMQVSELKLDRQQAREHWRKYKKHQHYSQPIDDEIRRTYQLIAQGRMVIQALESIKLAGVGDEGMPKLAIARADQKEIRCHVYNDGSSHMEPISWMGSVNGDRISTLRFDWPRGTFPGISWKHRWDFQAQVPLIPIHLRPKRAIQNYHILWEAEWTRVPPRDPYLLRRIGKADLWLVCAQWDLTDIERAALSTRVNAA